MKNATKKIAIGAALAAAAGYVAGVLTAPKSGKETRKDIKNVASRALTETEKKLKSLYGELNDLISKAKATAGQKGAKAKNQLDAAVDSAQKAKEKVGQVLSAIHEGGAEDKDLQKALTEANKAVKHLKTFLRKNG